MARTYYTGDGPLSDNALRVAQAVEDSRGKIPFGALMSTAEHESNFSPAATNESTGAAGVWQILPKYFGEYFVGNEAGARDVEKSTAGVVKHHGPLHDWIVSNIPGTDSSVRDYAFYFYFGHWAGRGGLMKAVDQSGGPQVVRPETMADWEGKRDNILELAQRAVFWEEWARLLRGTASSPFQSSPSRWVAPMLLALTGAAMIGLGTWWYLSHRRSRRSLT